MTVSWVTGCLQSLEGGLLIWGGNLNSGHTRICGSFVLFEKGFLCIALAVLELTGLARLALNSDLLPLLPKCWG